MCSYDIKLKLQKWEIAADESKKIIAALQKSSFINEERYARAYIREKLDFEKWGHQKILRTLKAKQLPSALIGSILAEFNDDRYRENLIDLLKKKNLSIKDESVYSRKAKLLRFALARGYEYEMVYELLSSKHFL
jgi:regulatory protein